MVTCPPSPPELSVESSIATAAFADALRGAFFPYLALFSEEHSINGI